MLNTLQIIITRNRCEDNPCQPCCAATQTLWKPCHAMRWTLWAAQIHLLIVLISFTGILKIGEKYSKISFFLKLLERWNKRNIRLLSIYKFYLLWVLGKDFVSCHFVKHSKQNNSTVKWGTVHIYTECAKKSYGPKPNVIFFTVPP